MASAAPPEVIGERVLDGVGWVHGPVANVFTFREGGRIYLVDAGFPHNASKVRLAFREVGVPLSSLTDILLTHQHPDHVGGAAYLRWVTHAKVSCHEMDAPTVEGKGPMTAPLFVRMFLAPQPVQVDRVLREGDQVGPFTVVSAPGHTLGSVAFYHPERKLLFCGDALVTSRHGAALARPFSNFDPDQAISSVEKLASLEVSAVFAGHGHPILSNGGRALREAAKKVSKRPEHRWWTLVGPEGHPETHPKPEPPTASLSA